MFISLFFPSGNNPVITVALRTHAQSSPDGGAPQSELAGALSPCPVVVVVVVVVVAGAGAGAGVVEGGGALLPQSEESPPQSVDVGAPKGGIVKPGPPVLLAAVSAPHCKKR